MTIEISIPGTDDVVSAYEIQGDELLDLWRVERARVDETGCWPLVIANWGGDLGPGYIAHERHGRGPTPRNRTPGQIVRASRDLDPVALLRERELVVTASEAQYFDDFMEREIKATEWAYGSAPTTGEVRAGIPENPTVRDVDRFLLGWEQSRERIQPNSDEYLGWYVPDQRFETPFMALVPTQDPAETVGCFSFFAEDFYPEVEASGLIAILRMWRERWGAELVANWGTMFQFVVESPPETLEQAWELAWQQALVAPCTVWSSGVSLRDHARLLLGRGDWFLHERP